MTFSIGRFGRSPVLDSEVVSWNQSGDTITTDGWIKASSEADAEALRQQLIGLANSADEPVVPVIWARDLAAGGFYSIVDAQVSSVVGYSYRRFIFKYQMTLQRAANGYTAQICESFISGGDRSIKPGGVTAVSWHGTPLATRMYDLDGTLPTGALRQGPGGYAVFYGSAHDYYSAAPTFRLPSSNWYDMAATVYVGGYPVCGRQIVSDPANWELSNGLVKITPGSGHLLDLTSPTFGSVTSWGTAKGVNAGYYDGSAWQPVTSALSLAVLRTSPEEAAIHIPIEVTIGSTGTMVNVDVSLRRGARMASVRVSSTYATKWGLGFSSVTACGTLTSGGGIKQTTADGDGNKAIILSSSGATPPDNTNGRMYTAGAINSHDLAIGHEVGGASSAAPDQGTDLRDQWFASTTETQQVVGQ